MPVFWFAVSFVEKIDWWNTVLIFLVLHVLLYPSSNGYNSYMDRDESSIGGLENPLQPTRQLFIVTIVMDVAACALAAIISPWFFSGVVFYILCSRLYSYRGVRLKRYPVVGYLTVILNQGAITFFIVWHGVQATLPLDVPLLGVVAASFLIGGFYPITQVYQHEADAKDGVTTLSILLGKKGTFIFCGLMYMVAFLLLYLHYEQRDAIADFLIMNLFFIPVVIYFVWWMIKVWEQPDNATFKRTMDMNWLASTCTSLAFITITCLQYRG